jgi:hypothetical protein
MTAKTGIRGVLALPLAVLTLTTSIVARAQPVDSSPAPSAASQGAQPSFNAESAVIEEVIEALDEGYRFNAYVVRWHGIRVLVSDPAGQGHLAVGDTLHFVAARADVVTRPILTFVSTEHDAGRGNQAALSAAPSTVQSETGTVEEVLQAQENGYRFTAYIVRWHGKRVAVIDAQSSPPHAVGDPIDLVVMRSSTMGRQILGFLEPPAHLEPAALRSTQDTGIVEEVLSGRVEGDVYTEFIVRWHGSQVAVSAAPAGPSSGATPGIGAGIPLTITRAKLPSNTGVLNFGMGTPVDSGALKESAQYSSIVVSNAKGTVSQVLSAQADDYGYRAYIVLWQGNRVAVTDAFASTRYQPGDPVAFTVARTGLPGNGQLLFTLFDFSCAQVVKGCKAPIAATH